MINFALATAVPLALLSQGISVPDATRSASAQYIAAVPKKPQQVGILEGRATTADARANISVKQAGERGAAVVALEKLRLFATWSDNWDGDGAPAPDARSLEAATLLLGYLTGELGEPPRVSLSADGEPMFLTFDQGFELAVTVHAPDDVGYLVARGEDEEAGSTEVSELNAPSDIIEAIRKLRA